MSLLLVLVGALVSSHLPSGASASSLRVAASRRSSDAGAGASEVAHSHLSPARVEEEEEAGLDEVADARGPPILSVADKSFAVADEVVESEDDLVSPEAPRAESTQVPNMALAAQVTSRQGGSQPQQASPLPSSLVVATPPALAAVAGPAVHVAKQPVVQPTSSNGAAVGRSHHGIALATGAVPSAPQAAVPPPMSLASSSALASPIDKDGDGIVEPDEIREAPLYSSDSWAKCNPACIQGRGVCNDDVCFCKTPYVGSTCQKLMMDETLRFTIPVAAILTVAALGIGVMLGVMVFWCCFRRQGGQQEAVQDVSRGEVWKPEARRGGGNSARG